MNIETRIKTRNLTKISLLIALLSISSYIIIPLPFSMVSITAQTIMINLISFLLNSKESFVTIFIYLLLGIIGFPVFSYGTSGFSRLLGPTGGYLLGYLVSVTLVSYLKGKYFNFNKCLILSIFIGIPTIYIFGCIHMRLLTSISLKTIISTSILPFVPLDILKCYLAAFLAKSINRIIH